MSGNNIELKSVSGLLGMKFFIPNYQRGYRWTEQQVKDLLEDIWEFVQKKKADYEFYCIQPLVVKKKDDGEAYEVIDGQQRLTTIFLILRYLKSEDQYELEYQRKTEDFDSAKFLSVIEKTEVANDAQIDCYYMSSAYLAIKKWFEENNVNKDDFCNALLKNVRFIWYETTEKDPIKVFRRLNSGKIPLTDAELIKALMLNSSNFGLDAKDHLKLRQQEIASEWDSIEYTLQNDEFWLFLHSAGYERPTRIDFIFDMIVSKNPWNIDCSKIGSDEYRTFRYFYEYFKVNKTENGVKDCWAKVKKLFQTFREWFNDLEMYHYVGFLVNQGEKLSDLYNIWQREKSKEEFISELKKKIKGKIKNCNNLYQQYEEENPSKTVCKPLLLLHNIQTVINQANVSKEEYKHSVFYKFPFHLYKKENWDVEHIDPNTGNDFSKKDTQNEFLLNIYHAVDDKTQEKIRTFIENKDADNWNEFEQFTRKQEDSLESKEEKKEKNQIWNFALLDSSTNRSYGNSIFSAKRRIIIGKDKGVLIPIPKIKQKDGKIIFDPGEEKKADSAFIPPCTKQVFLKYYSSVLTDYNRWTKSDAEAYRSDIYKTLKDFGVTLGEQDNE